MFILNVLFLIPYRINLTQKFWNKLIINVPSTSQFIYIFFKLVIIIYQTHNVDQQVFQDNQYTVTLPFSVFVITNKKTQLGDAASQQQRFKISGIQSSKDGLEYIYRQGSHTYLKHIKTVPFLASKKTQPSKKVLKLYSIQQSIIKKRTGLGVKRIWLESQLQIYQLI